MSAATASSYGSTAAHRRAAAQVLRGKSVLPLNPEEWGRQWPLGRGEGTRLVRDEEARRRKEGRGL